jgi:hypothetical protein
MPRQIAKLFFVLLLFAPIVNADPITVSGTIVLSNTNTTFPGVQAQPFVLTGTGFSANVRSFTGALGLNSCSTFAQLNPPCTTVNPSGQSTGPDIFGNFTINGETFPSNILNNLNLVFSSSTIVIPPELQNAPGVVIIAPFSFTGSASTTFTGLHVDLIGQGTVTIFLVQRDLGIFSGLYLDRAIYTFGPVVPEVSVEAVPEPMSLLLLASGLAGASILKRKRSRT